MRLSWIRNIFLFSTVVVLASSCADPVFSPDEPLVAAKRPAVYISGQNNFLFALDPKTGERIWERFFGVNSIKQEPIILGDYALVNSDLGVVILGTEKGNVLDTVTRLEFDGGFHTLAGAVSAEGEILYSGTIDSKLLAYNFVKKELLWTHASTTPTLMSSAGSFFGNLFIVHFDGKLFALNKNAGSEVSWTNTIGPISNAVVSPPNLYAMSPNGTLHALDLESGLEIWTYATGAAVNSSLVVYGGYILYGSDDNYLYCIDSISHIPRWTFKTRERIKGSAYGYEQAVYFGGYDHYVYSLDIIDGELNWKYRTNALIQGSPIAHEGMVYFPSYDQHLYAFDTTGSLKWKYRVNAPIDMSPVYNALNNTVIYPPASGLSSQ